MSSIGESMKKARKFKKLSQNKLAELAGASQASICRYERDEVYPNLAALINLADVLKISIDEYIGRCIN